MSSVNRLSRRRIGDILVSEGIVTPEQLDEALKIQSRTGELLGSILMDLGLVAEADVAKTICIQYQLPFITLSNYELDNKLAKLLPKEFLIAHKLLPFDKIGDMLLIMVTEIPPDTVLAEIPKLTNLNVALYVGYSSEVNRTLDSLFSGQKPASAAAAGQAGKAAPPQGPAPVEKAPSITRIESDDDEEEETSEAPQDDESEETGEGKTVVVTGDKTFLEELDSTWDSIFSEVESKGGKKPAP